MSSVTFHEGSALAPLIAPSLEKATAEQIASYCAQHGQDVPDDAALRLGLRRGWLLGWHAGFVASAIEARQRLDPEDWLDRRRERGGEARRPNPIGGPSMTPHEEREELLKLAEHWEGQCNRYTNGKCTTYGCCCRGGYGGVGPVDFEIATCPEHETAVALRALSQEKSK